MEIEMKIPLVDLQAQYETIREEGGGPEPQPGGMKTLSKTDTKNGLDNRSHYKPLWSSHLMR